MSYFEKYRALKNEKMKKLNFAGLGKVLNREELKEINGGTSGGYCQRYCYAELNGNPWIYGDTMDIPCLTTEDCPGIDAEDCGTQYGPVNLWLMKCKPLW